MVTEVKPVDKVYSEFLQEGSKYAQIRNLQEIFNEFIHQRDNYANRGLKLGGFYVSNGILNYKASKNYYYYVVKISDIEAYKKEKYKL